MAEPLSDFSKIAELQEIKRLYEESADRHSQDLANRDEEIVQLRRELNDIAQATATGSGNDGQLSALEAENDRLNKQVKLVRQEYDSKIERLNSRIKELSGAAAPTAHAEPDRKAGFFRR